MRLGGGTLAGCNVAAGSCLAPSALLRRLLAARRRCCGCSVAAAIAMPAHLPLAPSPLHSFPCLLLPALPTLPPLPCPPPPTTDIPELQPLADRVLVRVQESADVTLGGVILPDTAKERPLRCACCGGGKKAGACAVAGGCLVAAGLGRHPLVQREPLLRRSLTYAPPCPACLPQRHGGAGGARQDGRRWAAQGAQGAHFPAIALHDSLAVPCMPALHAVCASLGPARGPARGARACCRLCSNTRLCLPDAALCR